MINFNKSKIFHFDTEIKRDNIKELKVLQYSSLTVVTIERFRKIS